MNANLGSRRRFLYRLVVYSLTPWVGLAVLIANFEEPEGRLLGLIGLGVGALAVYLLFSRLRDPKSAVAFALRPVPTLRRLLGRWAPSSEAERDAPRALRAFLEEALPDVAVTERVGSKGLRALLVGDEVLVCVPSAEGLKPPRREELRRALADLRTPLKEEPILLVVLGRDFAPVKDPDLGPRVQVVQLSTD